MTKPNFKEMNRTELRKYVLAHREDEEAIHELFINRSTPNGKVYRSPLNKDGMRIMEEALLDTPRAKAAGILGSLDRAC